jgi:hypothetical protein
VETLLHAVHQPEITYIVEDEQGQEEDRRGADTELMP